jgi:MYXO-CTERM domain-containing protein
MSASGAKLGGAVQVNSITPTTFVGPPAIASDGLRYLIAWHDDGQIRTRRMAASDGALLDPFVMSAGWVQTTGRVAVTADTAPVADNRTFLVVWSADTTLLHGRLVRAKLGSMITPEIKLAHSADHVEPAATSDGSTFFVVWRSGYANYMGNIYGTRVDPLSGAMLDNVSPNGGRLLVGSGPFGQQAHPSVAWDDKNYLIVWRDVRAGIENRADVYGSRVQSDGLPLDAPASTGFLIANDMLAVNGGNYPVVASSGGGQSLVAYQRAIFDADEFGSRLRARVIDNDGTVSVPDAGVGGSSGAGGGGGIGGAGGSGGTDAGTDASVEAGTGGGATDGSAIDAETGAPDAGGVGGSGAQAGAGGAGGVAGAGSGGTPAAGGSSPGGGAGTGGSSAGGAAGAAASGGAPSGTADDAGCGCRVAGSTHGHHVLAAILPLAVMLLWRRRRPDSRRSA